MPEPVWDRESEEYVLVGDDGREHCGQTPQQARSRYVESLRVTREHIQKSPADRAIIERSL